MIYTRVPLPPRDRLDMAMWGSATVCPWEFPIPCSLFASLNLVRQPHQQLSPSDSGQHAVRAADLAVSIQASSSLLLAYQPTSLPLRRSGRLRGRPSSGIVGALPPRTSRLTLYSSIICSCVVSSPCYTGQCLRLSLSRRYDNVETLSPLAELFHCFVHHGP